MNAVNYGQALPNEILESKIFALLDYKSIARANQVCTIWKNCSQKQLEIAKKEKVIPAWAWSK